MKTSLIAITAALGLALSYAPAEAAKTKINCGWPHPDAACRAPSPVAPVAPVTPAPKPIVTKDVFSDILQFQAQIIADLQMADTTQAMPLNAETGQSWNPAAHMCLAGFTIGQPGQPGYMSSPGLISFVQSFPAPSVSQVPPLPAGAGPATIAVHAQDVINAALLDASALESTITNGSNSKAIQGLITACGAAVNTTLTQATTVGAQALAVEAVLGKFVVPLAMAHKAEAHKG